jgi:hypothetical protein
MKAPTNKQLKNELDRRYKGGYILVGAKGEDPIFNGKPEYELWLNCSGSGMCCLLEYACREYEPLKETAKQAAKGKNAFKESLQKALARIAKDEKRRNGSASSAA